MKIIDVSKCNEEVISYINELQNKYAELEKLNKELDRSNITIFEENNYLIKENKRLNNIINELEKCIKDKYYEAVDYQIKIRRSDLMQGDYPVSYYLSEQNEQLCDYFLNRLKDLQELKGEDKE